MKIIDFAVKGNLVRFWLGDDDCENYYGDDWDDYPYEHNAGPVYDEFVKGHCDIVFPFDFLVLEPCNDYYSGNSEYCKNDMKARTVPCILAVPGEIAAGSWHDDFSYWLGADKVKRFYFGDRMEPSDRISADDLLRP